MGRYALTIMNNKYIFVLLSLLIIGCQSGLQKIGSEHAKEVEKWQELARYAGNELKALDLTITAGVQINHSPQGTSYSIVNVQLNRNASHTEVDLLSPEFAEKFACGTECQKLGLYDSAFEKPETQLTSFFFSEEGRFFEFYGRLMRLNNTLADFQASSPDVLKKYLTVMLRRNISFNSLAEFSDYFEAYVSEEKLLAFASNGYLSPETDRVSPTFLNDLIANLPNKNSADNSPEGDLDWSNEDDVTMPDDDWDPNAITPDQDWSTAALTPDELLHQSLLNAVTPASASMSEKWHQARQYRLQPGSIACSYSDNSWGVVTALEADKVSVKVVAQARQIVDGMKLYLPPGYLFSSAKSFYFVKKVISHTYALSDVATCNIENFRRGVKNTEANASI